MPIEKRQWVWQWWKLIQWSHHSWPGQPPPLSEHHLHCNQNGEPPYCKQFIPDNLTFSTHDKRVKFSNRCEKISRGLEPQKIWAIIETVFQSQCDMHRALSVFAFYLLLGHQLVSPRGGGGWWGRVQAEVSIIKRCCHHHCHDSLYQSSRGFSSVRQNGWIPSRYYLHAWFTWQAAKLTRFLVDKIAGIWLMAWIFDRPT